MMLLTAVMVAEKTTRWGRRLSAPIGVGLLAIAAVLAMASLQLGPFASLLPGGT
jgi:predicted metal-binding membrane protein